MPSAMPTALDAQAAPVLPSLRLREAPVRDTARPRVKGSAEVGYVSTSGNTAVTTVNAGQRLTYAPARWRFEQFLQVVYGENAGEVNSRFVRAGVVTEYTWGGAVGVATGVLYDANRFNGIVHRTEEYAGVVWRALQSRTDSLRVDVGASLTQQRNVDRSTNRFPAARSAVLYARRLPSSAALQASAEFIPNLEETRDYRLNSSVALVAPLAKALAVRMEYQVRYDNVPEPTFQTTDRLFTTSLRVVF